MQKPPSIYEQVEQEFTCPHTATEIRRRDDSLGRVQYVRQCLTCGQAISSAIKHSLVGNPDKIPAFDHQIALNYEANKHARRDELYSESADHRGDFWDRYNLYLQSPAWQLKRAKVLKRDNYTCRACGERRATQAHHLTYAHVFNEPLFDLVAVCEACHKELTRESQDVRRAA